MKKNFPQEVLLPLNTKDFYKLQKLASSSLSTLQMAWISGYFWGNAAINNKKIVQESYKIVTLLSASQTGNARRLAEQLRDDLIKSDIPVVLINTGEYKFKKIEKEKILIIISSTQGSGEPPEEAVAFYKYLFSPKAPLLKNTYFAVFGLGDSSYEQFAKIGKDFDRRLEELGAHRLYDRVDADVDYQSKADCWRIEIVKILKSYFNKNSIINNKQLINNKSNLIVYKKDKPFSATIISNQKITSRSSFKDIRHIELDISNSCLKYQPGDALGVWYENDSMLIKELIELLCLKENEKVQVDGKSMVLSEALRKKFDLTQNTPSIVSNYAVLTKNKKLLSFVNDKEKIQYFAKITPIVDMVYYAPTRLNAQQLLNLLRPLTPRLYSIASSQAIVEEEVHITVGVVRYEIDGRARTGGASGYLADRVVDGDKVNIFIEKNDNFRLPEDNSVPIIMIGPGTGIAPFRAFMQQRDADSAKGKNWIFFGNQHFIDDFIYQLEWKNYFKSGLLTKIDLAWSRDQHKKIYVQDILVEKSSEVWYWIKQGAHIYVCGDAINMARDIDKTLLNIVSEYGDMGKEQADEFLSEMRIERRYQRDVY